MKKLVLFSLNVLLLSSLGCSFPLQQVGLFKTGDVKVDDVLPLGSDNDTVITFEVVAERVLVSCKECHSFNQTRILEKQNDILGRIHARDASVMPPTTRTPLTECQKQILTIWLEDQKVGRASGKIGALSACGGEDSTTTAQPAPAPTPSPSPTPPAETVDYANLEVSYENLKKYILEPKCLRCHTPEEGKSRTLLTSTSEIQAQELIDSTAESSVLYQVVIPGMNKRFMPPARSALPPLTAEEADYLKRWILSVPPNEWL